MIIMLRQLVIVTIVMLLGGCGPITFTVGGRPSDQRLSQTIVEDDGRWFSSRVAIVDVSGLIYNAHKRGILSMGDNPVSLLYEKLEMARRDRSVKAIILRINSPGGTVTASDAMYRQVMRFKKQTGKPVIVLMMDVAASGGYYLACSGDRIVAYPTTVTGSIGVIVQTISLKPALNRLGITTEAITSGKHKAAGSYLSTLTPEQRAIFQRLVDDFYSRFVQVVRSARTGITEDQFQELTDGRVMSGEQAAKAGLVDTVGDLHNAFELAKHMAHIKSADLVMYHRPLTYAGSPYATLAQPVTASQAHTVEINLAQVNIDLGAWQNPIGFFYLWQMDAP